MRRHKRATATCSEEVGFDDGSSCCLTALRKRCPTQTLRRAALGWLAEVCLSTRFLPFGTCESARCECRFAFPCCNITTDSSCDNYRLILSSRRLCGVESAGDHGACMKIVQVHSRKGQVKLPQGFVICGRNDDHMQRTIKEQSERKISNICINLLIIKMTIVKHQSLCSICVTSLLQPRSPKL